MTLTKQYRVVYSGTTIINSDWQEIQTGETEVGNGRDSFESDNLADVQAQVTALGLALPVDPNAP